MNQEEIINYDDPSMNEQFIKAREYEEATSTVVRTLGREAGVSVVFTGTEAKVGEDKKSDKIVVLPANDPSNPMTKRQYFIGQGFANHETLHTVCTDIKHMQNQLKSMQQHEQHLAYSLTQAIEDIRIEHAGKKSYPGMPTKLDATAQFAAEHFLTRDKAEIEELAKDFKKIGPIAMTWAARKKMGYNAPNLDKCLDFLPEDVQKLVDQYSDEALGLRTGVRGIGDIDRKDSFVGTREAIELARRISQELEKPPEEEPEDEQNQQQANGGSGQGGNQGNGSQSHASSGHGSVGISKEFMKPVDPDFLVHVAPELKFTPSGHYYPYTTALDTIVRSKDQTYAAKHTLRNGDNLRDYKLVMDKLTGKMAVMRRKLERALMAKMDREYTPGHRTGKIDVAKKGSDIVRGRENVFKKRSEGVDIDAAVTILIDASGSMDNKIHLAQQSCIAIAEAIARVGVPLEILVFNTRAPDDDEVPNSKEIVKQLFYDMTDADRKFMQGAARREPMCIYEVKSFDQNMTQARMGMGGIDKMVAAANADPESVLKAWERLKKRPEKNKILMVLSDGEPACGGGGRETTQLKLVVDQIAKEGCNCVGIGILSKAVSRFYPKWTVVTKLEDLAGTTIDNIARMLLGERFVIDNAQLNKAA